MELTTVTNSTQAEELTIGKYKLLKTIGKGAFAEVMLAKHVLTGEEVAIKIFDKTQLEPGLLQGLYREAKIMKMLDHPNIVKLFQVIETATNFYLVMEYASGGSMYDYLARQGRMNENVARAKFRQIVSAVRYLHQKKIVHRDLKDGNILLDSEMNIKIADFGYSQQFTSKTKLKAFCGTLRYAAPEVLLCRKYGPKADVWSLGVVLYRIVSNALPFDSSILPVLREQMVRGEYEVPFFLTSDCVNLLKKLLVLDPTRRAGLDTVAKDKWMNQGYESDDIKPWMEPEQGLTDPKRIASLVCLGFNEIDVVNSLNSQKYDDAFATYLLLGRSVANFKSNGI
ncbi:MAP/microtubule affinity-regulating kinase 3-like [Leptinotarsa decemlineata]|uniref:MAP/microtubule affinity-regulating kinase 3-like n=1 Tax=Leptinotarsa decemlineata TaxID=7539 RepID=UPI003D309F52